MKTFSNAANLRGMLLHPDCPVILQEAMPIINKAWKMKDLLTDTADSTPSRSSKTVHSRSTVELELGNALAVFLQVLFHHTLFIQCVKSRSENMGFQNVQSIHLKAALSSSQLGNRI